MKFQDIIGTRIAQASLGTSYAVIYKVPADTRTYIKGIDICNTTSSPISVYVSLVPTGETAGASNALFYNASVPGSTTVQWTGTQIILQDDTIQVRATASGCTISISGGEAS